MKERTKGKIANLLPPDALDGGTKMALVNAAYFKGEWQSKFEKAETEKDNFYVRRDKIRVTDFMHQKGKFNYYTSEELRAHVLELPYNGDDISMVIILPPFEDDALKVGYVQDVQDELNVKYSGNHLYRSNREDACSRGNQPDILWNTSNKDI